MKIAILLLCSLISNITSAQKQKLPILKTNSTSISIKEGDFLYKDTWNVSPEIKLDIFVTNQFSDSKKVTFYSDIDSISFTVKPNKTYDFIILLNGKNSAYTQISTSNKLKPTLEPKLIYTKLDKLKVSATDTIPFQLGADDGIYLKGKINGSETLDFLFDTGAGACVITSSIINKKVNIIVDGSTKNTGTDGTSIVGTSAKNTIEISNLIWDNVSLLSIDYDKRSFDIILGWIAFENKIVEIDYE